jgi:DUF2950 family protein
MSHLPGVNNIRVVRAGLSSALIVTLVSMLGCGRKQEKAAVGTTGTETQKTFASPSEAGKAFVDAARSGDQAALLAIFGPDGKDVLFSGDPAKHQNALRTFVAAYETMNRWGKINGGGQMLYVGAENFQFPVPLLQNSSGRWYFDSAGGADEILARRIGRNELVAMAATAALARAQQQYFTGTHASGDVKQYAQQFVSDDGKQLSQLGDFAQPFNGYHFRILTKQGDTAKGGAKDYIVNGKMTRGFAILAYPAVYQNSGIMSFLVGPDGIVYEKDLGPKTADTAVALTEYNPGDGWKPVNRQPSAE